MTKIIITEKINASGASIEKQQEFSESDEGFASVAASVPASTDDKEVAWSCDQSQLKALYMVADGDLTVETNDGTTPDDTISLKAGIPYIWYTNKYDTCKITTDVTKLFLSNAGASAVNFQLKSLVDSTP